MSLLPGGDPRYDVGRTGSPVWARHDDGPMNTYVPGPLSSEPLQSSYHADVRLIVSGVIFAAVIVFALVSSREGALGSVLIIIGLWALYAVPVLFRRRIGLRVDGSRCEVHGLFSAVAFDGVDVAKVQFVFSGKSPDVRLVLRDGRRVLVVASRLEKGHSTLYEWLRRYAPEAEYDKRALDLRDTLVNRGLTGAPGDPWDEAGRYGPAPISAQRAAAPVPSPISREPIAEEPLTPIVGEPPLTPAPEEPLGKALLTPAPQEPMRNAPLTSAPEEPVGEADRRHEGSSTPPIETGLAAEERTTEGTAPDGAPSDRVKTSQPPEAKAPDSTETRTDDDEQA